MMHSHLSTRARTTVLRLGPSLTLAAAVAAASLTAYPLWAWVVAALLAWVPWPLSVPALILDRDLEDQHALFLSGASLRARLRHYIWLLTGDNPLSVDLRATLAGLAVSCGLAALILTTIA